MSNVQAVVRAQATEDKLQEFVCACENDVQRNTGEDCKSLGDRKHKCVDDKIKNHNSNAKVDEMIGSEVGFNDDLDILPFDRKQTYASVRSGTKWPDSCSFDANGDPYKFFDFKFKCPTAEYSGRPNWSPGQKEKYEKLTKKLGHDPNKDKNCMPKIIDNTDCPAYGGKQ